MSTRTPPTTAQIETVAQGLPTYEDNLRAETAPAAPAPIIQGSDDDHLRGLLTCGHYTGDIYNRSSTWDFTYEEQGCSHGCEGPVYFTEEVQTLAARTPDDPAVVAGIVPGPKVETGVTLTDEEAAAVFIILRDNSAGPAWPELTTAADKLRGGYQRANTR